MKDPNKITLAEIKKRFTEIWKKKNDLKAFIKHNNNIIEDISIERAFYGGAFCDSVSTLVRERL